jgi:hypothetical protein
VQPKGTKSCWCVVSNSQVNRTFSAIAIKRPPAFDHCTRLLASARLRFVKFGGDIGFLGNFKHFYFLASVYDLLSKNLTQLLKLLPTDIN